MSQVTRWGGYMLKDKFNLIKLVWKFGIISIFRILKVKFFMWKNRFLV